MQLRPYQNDCIAAVNRYLRLNDGHPVCSLPTASGKTIIFASMIQQWMEAWPETRVCILAHRQELLAQAEDKLLNIWPDAPVGIYSAGLKRREDRPILIAGIQSIYKKAEEFDPFDILILDEVHLCPNKSETMYRSFIGDCLERQPGLRIIGWTATPYRLDGGHLCGPEKLFASIAYSADINELIEKGFICQLRTKATKNKMETHGIFRARGDFIQSQLEARFAVPEVVEKAVDEIIELGKDRKSWLIFTCGVRHAEEVNHALLWKGITAPIIIGKTQKEDRRKILEDFSAGKTRAVVNVNCLTTGLDVPRIDLIAVLRPTESTSLWVQMVGRGFRLYPEKQNCLVLDFAGNCARHGPLNCLYVKKKGSGGEGQAPPIKTCPDCNEIVMAGTGECPECGHIFPPRKSRHDAFASSDPIISTDKPKDIAVTLVTINRHKKEGKPDSMRVQYHSSLAESYSEWICFSHEGYARQKAEQWWLKRWDHPIPESTDDVMSLAPEMEKELTEMVRAIRVVRDGKYWRIVKTYFEEGSLIGERK